MRGQPQAAGARLLTVVPARRWSTWRARENQTRSRLRAERLETMARLEAEQRRAQRAGEYAPDLRRLW